MKNPGTLTGEVINSLLQLPLSLAACTPVLCWRNRKVHPALTSLIVKEGEEWVIRQWEILTSEGRKWRICYIWIKQRTRWALSLFCTCAPNQVCVKSAEGMKRKGRWDRLAGDVWDEGVKVRWCVCVRMGGGCWLRGKHMQMKEYQWGSRRLTVWLEHFNPAVCPPLRFSGGRLLLPVQPRIRRPQMWAGPRRLREQLVQRQLHL